MDKCGRQSARLARIVHRSLPGGISMGCWRFETDFGAGIRSNQLRLLVLIDY
jgi:hypothetical protein